MACKSAFHLTGLKRVMMLPDFLWQVSSRAAPSATPGREPAKQKRGGAMTDSDTDEQPWAENCRGARSLLAAGLCTSPLEPPSWGDLGESMQHGWPMRPWEHAGVGPAALGPAVRMGMRAL